MAFLITAVLMNCPLRLALMMSFVVPYLEICFFVLVKFSDHFVFGNNAPVDVERHVEFGMNLMAKGQYMDALTHLHVAVEHDPENYLTYYRRATAYLAIGKSSKALLDLEVVTSLKPDFLSAWIQRGSILLKQGRLDEAHINFESVLRRDPGNQESIEFYNVIEPVRQHMQLAQSYVDSKHCAEAIEHLTHAIEVCPWDPALRDLRADCNVATGNMLAAIMDLKAVIKLRGVSAKAHEKLSLLHFSLGETEESLSEVRECLKLDADDKDCFRHYKKVKKLAGLLKSASEYLESGQYAECLEKADAVLVVESTLQAYLLIAKSLLCQCHNKGGQPFDAISSCSEAIQIEGSINLFCNRAEAYINNEEYDEAMSDYQRAKEIDQNAQCVREGIQRVQKLQKLAKRRDYYKILGVRRTATKREILKAYRKLAQKWHPDSFSGEEKKFAEKKFIDIASAKEVLSNPEKREKFDSGEDPLDPESQAQQGFHPFGQGFHPFQGQGPFQFRFHFN